MSDTNAPESPRPRSPYRSVTAGVWQSKLKTGKDSTQHQQKSIIKGNKDRDFTSSRGVRGKATDNFDGKTKVSRPRCGAADDIDTGSDSASTSSESRIQRPGARSYRRENNNNNGNNYQRASSNSSTSSQNQRIVARGRKIPFSRITVGHGMVQSIDCRFDSVDLFRTS